MNVERKNGGVLRRNWREGNEKVGLIYFVFIFKVLKHKNKITTQRF